MIKPYYQDDFGVLYHGDCLEIMPQLDIKADMVLCDPPYEKTQNKWDSIIDLERMWGALSPFKNKPHVFTAAQPFTTLLISSNYKDFKFCDVWDKKAPRGFLNSKKMPLRRHEDVVVFCGGRLLYNPIMRIGKYRNRRCGTKNNGCYGDVSPIDNYGDQYYPTSIIEISSANQKGKVHPNQKPDALMEYLIRTYTNAGDTVLDFAAGSGTTGVAAINTQRRYILIEREEKYCEIAAKRLSAHRN